LLQRYKKRVQEEGIGVEEELAYLISPLLFTLLSIDAGLKCIVTFRLKRLKDDVEHEEIKLYFLADITTIISWILITTILYVEF